MLMPPQDPQPQTPNNPVTNNPYEFIRAPSDQTKKTTRGSLFSNKKLLIIGGLLGLLMIVIIIAVSFSGGSGGSSVQLASLVAEHNAPSGRPAICRRLPRTWPGPHSGGARSVRLHPRRCPPHRPWRWSRRQRQWPRAPPGLAGHID